MLLVCEADESLKMLALYVQAILGKSTVNDKCHILLSFAPESESLLKANKMCKILVSIYRLAVHINDILLDSEECNLLATDINSANSCLNIIEMNGISITEFNDLYENLSVYQNIS